MLFDGAFLSALILLAPPVGEIRVDEGSARLSIESGRTRLSLPIDNGSHEELPVSIEVELLDPRGAVVSRGVRTVSLRPGRMDASVGVEPSLDALDPAEGSQVLYYRSRYRVAPSSAASEILPLRGTISISELTRDLFELDIIQAEYARAGRPHQVIVAARHPVTGDPVAGVHVEGSLSGDEGLLGRAATTTDSKGIAALDLPIPGDLEESAATLAVRASKGPAFLDKEDELFIYQAGNPLLTTDKSLYQPGQTLHMRLLAFDASRRAIDGAEASFQVRDEERRLVFATRAKTSRFGIASADWVIPESVRLGNYWVETELERDRWGGGATGKEVRISRYEIPQFFVEAAPDKPFYLSGERASVEVRAQYLFGKPVERGRVRVSRAEKRYWDYRRGRWASEGRQDWTGELDRTGRSVIEIDLSRDWRELDSRERWQSDDLAFQAYVTDAGTGRTEERRFDVRITRDPIHVYWIDGQHWGAPSGAPFDFYLSTFSADGSPLECGVTVQVLGEDDDPGPVLASARTNRFGVAKVERFTVPPGARSGPWGGVEVLLTARDDRGRVGRWTESVWTDDTPRIDVRMDRTLHRPGERIGASIVAPPEVPRVALFLTRNDEVLRALMVDTQEEVTAVSIPYDPSFRGSLSVVAFPLEEREDILMGSHPVVFPYDDELRIAIETERKHYRPGELAEIQFDVRRPDGSPTESALGVTVVDRALLERERTDEEFGSNPWPYGRFWGDWLNYGESLGAVSKKDILRLDSSRFPEGMDLVAEILFRYPDFYPGISETERYRTDVSAIFKDAITKELAPLVDALDGLYRDGAHPAALGELEADLARVPMRFLDLEDPWDRPFRAELFPRGAYFVFSLASDGPDEKEGTNDDFVPFQCSWNHFGRAGRALDSAVTDYHARTGRFIRDYETLRPELLLKGFDTESLVDPWGRKYEFELGVDKTHYFVRVSSGDAKVWNTRIDYFAETRERIQTLLDGRLAAAGTWPDNPRSLEAFLKRNGASLEKERDPWGRHYSVDFTTEWTYADRVEVVGRNSAPERGKTTVTPVTRRLRTIHIRSEGPRDGEGDPFEVARFQRVVEESEQAIYAPTARVERVPSRDRGAIGGTVTDSDGGVLPGVSVTLSSDSLNTWKTTTGTGGEYLFQDLRAGNYSILFDLAGFKRLTLEEVPVLGGEKTIANAELSLASVGETVTVTGESPAIHTTSSAVGAATVSSGSSIQVTGPIMTPRLRQFFPETLWWEPELRTDGKGRVRFALPLADNVTTWNLSTIASNVEGEVGLAETEIVSFQPFFIDLDPPAVLTVGDRIQQPVLLRSYLEDPVRVEVAIEDEPGFRLLNERKQMDSIPAGGTARRLFDIEMVAPTDRGRQRVTAVSGEGPEASDAVEKSFEIRPDGQAIIVNETRIFEESGARFSIEIPEHAMEGSVRGEIRIYPSLIAHVLESLDAVRQRPYGCTEQTISAAYPGLHLLRYHRDRGGDVPSLESALRDVSLAYQTLLTRQNPDGGFSYWDREHQDLSLTAYAVGFLADARAFLDVDERVEAKARQWLLAQQKEDGRWVDEVWRGNRVSRDALVTAAVTRTLAQKRDLDLSRALDYLAERSEEIDEPYLISTFALAAHAVGQRERAERAVDRLRSLARSEGSGAHWHLETNTPFYGWGRAGRIETTALATLALARIGGFAADESLIDRGLVFLLRNKDRFGGWYSTQATMRVVETLLELLPREGSSSASMARSLELIVNGGPAHRVMLPAANEVRGPVHKDLSKWLARGANEVRLVSDGALSAAAEVVSSYYRAWPTQTSDTAESADLRFAVRYRGLESRIGETIEARVEVERVGFRGYGMMLAEIGIPPGAEVDRSSLEDALGADGVSGYEVLPDRVVFYLWPRAGGVRFSFNFRPRFSMRASSSPSRLYDYYNPESEVVLAPKTFRVR